MIAVGEGVHTAGKRGDILYRERASNPHGHPGQRILSPLRLPIPPSRPETGKRLCCFTRSAYAFWQPSMHEALAKLTLKAHEAAARSLVPLSSRPRGAALLLSDGSWVPGCRVESAALPLSITALQSAVAGAVASGSGRVVAAALSSSANEESDSFLLGGPFSSLRRVAPNAYAAATDLPMPGDACPPAPPAGVGGIEAARSVAERAYIPVSGFAVGCVARLRGGSLIAGCNVEHQDWHRMLCAERSVLAARRSFGLPRIEDLYVSCISAEISAPCGACRQLLVEQAPGARIWMDARAQRPKCSTPGRLLPSAFRWTPQ